MNKEEKITDIFPKKEIDWKSELNKQYKLKVFVLDDYLEVLEELFKVVGHLYQANPKLDLVNFDYKDLSVLLPVTKEIKTILGKFCQTETGRIGKELTAKDISILIIKFIEFHGIEEIVKNFTLARNYLSTAKKPAG